MLNLVFWCYNASARHHPWFHSDVPCILKIYFVKKKLHASHPHVRNYLTWMVVAIYLSSMLLTMLASAPISSFFGSKKARLFLSMLQIFPMTTVFQVQCQPEQYIYRILFFWLLGFPFFVYFVVNFPSDSVFPPDAARCNKLATVAWQASCFRCQKRTFLLFRSTHKTIVIHNFSDASIGS